MNKAIERQIKQIYDKVYKEVFTKKNTDMLANGSRMNIEQSLNIISSSQKYEEFAKKFALELTKKGIATKRGIWKKYYEAAKKTHYISLPATYKDFELKIMTETVRHNFNMIKTIPSRMLEILNHKYTAALIEEVAKGNKSRGSFARLLASHGQKQAKLIARTETAKLQTAITKQRAVNVGAITYTWLSSHDRRTRPSHQAMNAVIVFWRPDAEKPLLDNMRGDAGEFPNCRCDAQPNVDIDDFTNARYKVYDYRINKIIWMSKIELINAIQNGEL